MDSVTSSQKAHMDNSLSNKEEAPIIMDQSNLLVDDMPPGMKSREPEH